MNRSAKTQEKPFDQTYLIDVLSDGTIVSALFNGSCYQLHCVNFNKEQTFMIQPAYQFASGPFNYKRPLIRASLDEANSTIMVVSFGKRQSDDKEVLTVAHFVVNETEQTAKELPGTKSYPLMLTMIYSFKLVDNRYVVFFEQQSKLTCFDIQHPEKLQKVDVTKVKTFGNELNLITYIEMVHGKSILLTSRSVPQTKKNARPYTVVRLYDVSERKVLKSIWPLTNKDSTTKVVSAAISPSGKLVAIAENKTNVQIWSLGFLTQKIHTVQVDGKIQNVMWSEDNNTLAITHKPSQYYSHKGSLSALSIVQLTDHKTTTLQKIPAYVSQCFNVFAPLPKGHFIPGQGFLIPSVEGWRLIFNRVSKIRGNHVELETLLKDTQTTSDEVKSNLPVSQLPSDAMQTIAAQGDPQPSAPTAGFETWQALTGEPVPSAPPAGTQTLQMINEYGPPSHMGGPVELPQPSAPPPGTTTLRAIHMQGASSGQGISSAFRPNARQNGRTGMGATPVIPSFGPSLRVSPTSAFNPYSRPDTPHPEIKIGSRGVASGRPASNHGLRKKVFKPDNQEIREIPAEQLKKIRKLGEGGLGKVQLEEWAGEGRQVAVKYLKSATTQNPEVLKSFLLELQIQASLEHVNIVAIVGKTTRDKKMGIVMEFCPHGDLDKLIHNPNMKIAMSQQVHWFLQIVKGLAYLHGQNIVHRDLKLLNILVARSWVCKIGDFGLGKLLGNETHNTTDTKRGTPIYTAPEIFRAEKGAQTRPAQDIYALGVILLEMITRVRPFEGIDIYQVVFKVAQENFRPDVPKDLNPRISGLIRWCWQDDYKKRPTINKMEERAQPLLNTFPEPEPPTLTN